MASFRVFLSLAWEHAYSTQPRYCSWLAREESAEANSFEPVSHITSAFTTPVILISSSLML